MNQEQLNKLVKQGKILIYPTDTVYGIGCNALDSKAVYKIRNIKARDKDKPLSIIAPSIDWIKENCIIEQELMPNLEKYLPGPYTLILKKKDPNFLTQVSNTDSLGIRIPDSKFTKQIQETGIPFITTSVNLSGEPFAVKISNISNEIKSQVDEIIDIGELNGRPSTLIINGKEIKR